MPKKLPMDSITVDPESGTNLHRQIYSQLRALIERRALSSGTTLPSTRELARDLGVGRNSVIAAYDQLALEGYLRTRKGAAPQVVDLPMREKVALPPAGRSGHGLSLRGQLLKAQRYHAGEPGLMTFHPGMPDPDCFPFNTWSKLLGQRARLARQDLFGAYYLKGYPPLREAIARYLTVSRGVNCSPEQIIVTNGAQSAFDLLARILLDPGDVVWMEEPGYYGARAAFLSAGAKLAPLPVDASGWQITPPSQAPKVIFVTPSCQYPLGVTMSTEQRLNLLQAAEKSDAWIIEDDYDSEYRFQGQPIPALQGLDMSSRVVFVGTFAKILFPAMRLGFMVVPAPVSEGLEAALAATGQFAPLVTQAALADFMNEGHLIRHLRRTRRLYAQRRELFADEFEAQLGEWMQVARTDTGIQVVARFVSDTDDCAFAAAARHSGVNVSPLSMQYYQTNPPSGLLMGFAASDSRDRARGFRKLRDLHIAGPKHWLPARSGTGPEGVPAIVE